MNFKRTASLVATTSLVFGLAGCAHTASPLATGFGANSLSAYGKHVRAEKGGTWTILVHMAADNNLYRFGLDDLNEMEAGLNSDDVNVIVLFDGIKNGDSCIYQIKHDPNGKNSNIISQKLDDGGAVIPANHEIDSGDVKTLNKFVSWAAKKFPADHTALDIWDHGSGLFDGGPQPITRGFGWDDNGSHMSTNDLGPITSNFKAVSGKPLDLFIFDACLMSHLELAYQMAGNCNYLCASEELEPGPGYDYNGWLNDIAKLGANKTPAGVASAAVDSYVGSYQPGGAQASGRDQATYTATDINAVMNNVVPALNNFVAASSRNMGANKAAFQAARAKAKSFYNQDCADLGSFLAGVKTTSRDAEVTRAADDLQKAYASAIIKEGHTSNENGATGLVVYFPTPNQRINPVYNDASKIAFAKESWKDFLANYR